MRILCVCLGNICRSPMAEAVLRAKGRGRVTVDSAGTGTWHLGDPPYGPAIEAAKARGYDLSPLRARQVEARDFQAFDLILAMDRQNLADIEARRPPGNATPVTLFLDYAANAETRDIPDPYFTRDFEGALDMIEAAADGLLAQIGRG